MYDDTVKTKNNRNFSKIYAYSHNYMEEQQDLSEAKERTNIKSKVTEQLQLAMELFQEKKALMEDIHYSSSINWELRSRGQRVK